MEGKLIAIEGIDCAGKSTIVNNISSYFSDCRTEVKILSEFRSPLTKIIKKVLFNKGSPFIKTYLFATDRAWTYEKECLPALERGNIVIWDRYVDSATVYRKIELLNKEDIITTDFVREINMPFIKAHMTFFIDISPETAMLRAKENKRCEPYDISFLAQVRSEYLKLVNGADFFLINGERNTDVIQKEITNKIKIRFKDLFNEY